MQVFHSIRKSRDLLILFYELCTVKGIIVKNTKSFAWKTLQRRRINTD